MNRKKQLSFLKVPMSGTNCTFRISNSWTQTIVLLMKSTRIIGSLRRIALMWIKLRRYCFKCFHQRDSSLKGTIRKVPQSMLHWFRYYVRQRKLMSSLWGALSDIDRILLLYLKCMSLDRLRGIVLTTTLETHLVVSGRKYASLEETSTRERYF